MKSFTRGTSKIDILETNFSLPKITIQDMQSMFWAAFMCFSPYLAIAGGRGVQTGLVHNLLMQFLEPLQLKLEVSEKYFFDIVIT